MTTIIAGTFESKTRAEAAVSELLSRGCTEENVSTYHNNAPGQHAAHPIGGDEDTDPGSHGAQGGAVKGIAAGMGVGAGVGALVGGPIGAVAGAAAGAYAGALGGALNSLGDDAEKDQDADRTTAVTRRPAGIMVAVNADHASSELAVIGILRDHAALTIEKTQGEWKDGQWTDFDPTSVPRFVAPAPQRLFS